VIPKNCYLFLRGGISFNVYCIINFDMERLVVTRGIGFLCEGFVKKSVASSGPVAATHGINGDQMKTQCHTFSSVLFVEKGACLLTEEWRMQCNLSQKKLINTG
jgi:hypothetical protein